MKRLGKTSDLIFFPVLIGESDDDCRDRLGLVVSGDDMLSILRFKTRSIKYI
jgi:hypothetical protein